MATIKSYTDLEQSKKLAEILPLESTDMYYDRYGDPYFINVSVTHERIKNDKYHHLVPCWSLAALLGVLPHYQLQTQDDGIGILCSCNGKFIIVTADNPVDACVNMIIKLHELKRL